MLKLAKRKTLFGSQKVGDFMREQDKSLLYFDELLSSAMNDAGLGCMSFEELLKEKGVIISFKTISAYMRGIRLPYYERAKIMLNALEVPMEEEELIELLKRSRERIKKEKSYFKEEETEIRKTITIRIKTKNISPEIPAYQGMRLLEDRIRDLFGDENKLSDYVKMLIMKDLREFILEKKDIEKDIETEEEEENGN